MAGIPAPVRDLARRLGEEAHAASVLFYGSNLRTGSLEGVLDFYVLTQGPVQRGIWPHVSYREWEVDGVTLRAKVATMTLETFAKAARGELLDTTIWARFVQPSAVIWSRGEAEAAATRRAIEDAAATAARLAVALGPARGTIEDYWRALFRATYRAEFRVEPPGREDAILSVNRAHFMELLPRALDRIGIVWRRHREEIEPDLSPARRRQVLRWWRKRRRLGKPYNLVRLVRATATFDGAARYGAWKLERHTGIRLELTPWQERHPLLAAPGAAWRIWRLRGRARARQK